MADAVEAARSVRPILEGHHSLTSALGVDNAAEAIESYTRAFGAQELFRMPGPDGQRFVHAELQIGDSRLMLSDEFPDRTDSRSPKSLGATASSLHLYVEDADAVFQRALAAGATVRTPLMDAFWGDRYGVVTDPFGHHWGIATHREDLSNEEARRRAAVFDARSS